MIEKIVEQGLTSYYDSFDNWEDAVAASYQGMLKKNIIKKEYIDEVISSIKEFGPYVVIAPQVAMPHSTCGSSNVSGTAFSFMRVKNPVIFDVEDSSKNARLFFSFAAEAEDAHLKNMVKLVELLINEEFVNELFDVNNDVELLEVLNKYQKD